MLLRKVKEVSNKVSYRLAFVYLCFFIPCFFIAYGSLFYLTSTYLEKRDRDVLEVRLQQFQDIFEIEGVPGFKRIVSDVKLHNQSMSFLIRITDPKNNIIFIHLPEESEYFDIEHIETFIKIAHKNKDNLWYQVPSKNGEEGVLEFKSISLRNGYKLLVGASTDDRDDLLEKFRSIFFMIMIPFLIISFFGVIYIAQKILKPLESLTLSISEVKAGRLSSRVLMPYFKDELYELSLIFNQMINQIELLVKALTETVDNIAHDLKTPISRARMTAEMAIQSGSPTELKIAAEETIENCDNILAIIQAILTTARYDAKTVKLNKTRFRVKDLFKELIELYYFVAEEKSISVEIFCPDIEIWGDRLILKQSLANLFDNALKYSSPNTKIYMSCHETSNEVILIVKDEGPGISTDELPKIWERLYRGDKSRHEPGMGLGLSLVKVFVESHYGNITVVSELEKGAVFSITLPKV